MIWLRLAMKCYFQYNRSLIDQHSYMSVLYPSIGGPFRHFIHLPTIQVLSIESRRWKQVNISVAASSCSAAHCWAGWTEPRPSDCCSDSHSDPRANTECVYASVQARTHTFLVEERSMCKWNQRAGVNKSLCVKTQLLVTVVTDILPTVPTLQFAAVHSECVSLIVQAETTSTRVEAVTPTKSCSSVRWIPACIPTCFGISVVSSGKAFCRFSDFIAPVAALTLHAGCFNSSRSFSFSVH